MVISGVPARPTELDTDVKAIAVSKIMPEIIKWSLGSISADDQEAVDDVVNCIDDGDGYAIVRTLDRQHGWSCDSDLVEILDGAVFALSNACREQTRKWIDGWGISPLHVIGDHVTWKGNDAEITSLGDQYSPGKYTLFIPAEGHVREGTGTHGNIVAWELVDENINASGLTVTGPLFREEQP